MTKKDIKYIQKKMKQIHLKDIEEGRKQLRKTRIRFEQDYE